MSEEDLNLTPDDTDKDSNVAPGTELELPQNTTELEPHARTEHIAPSKEVEWTMGTHSSEAIKRPIDGVFLGATPNRDGWGSTYKDSVATKTEDGFIFGVAQNSAGFTGIEARPAQGFRVDVLNKDEDGSPIWEPTDPKKDHVAIVSGDWGDYDFDKSSSWDQLLNKKEQYGNEGTHIGVIRVTSPQGETKYFALGADFKGREDNWRVTGSYAEVFPKSTEALESMHHRYTLAHAAEIALALEAPEPRNEEDYYINQYGERISPDPLFEERLAIRVQVKELFEYLSTHVVSVMGASEAYSAEGEYSPQNEDPIYYKSTFELKDGTVIYAEILLPHGRSKDAGKQWTVEWRTIKPGGDDKTIYALSLPPDDTHPERHTTARLLGPRHGQPSRFDLDQHHEKYMYEDMQEIKKAMDEMVQLMKDIDDFDKRQSVLKPTRSRY